MYCKHCGTTLPEDARFCTNCGAQIGEAPDSRPGAGGGRVGYSERIHDPAFAQFIRMTNRWSVIFSIVLAVAAVIGFYIYGETSREMESPQALFIGLSIGGMFLLVTQYSIHRRKRKKTWDGVVVDKTIKKKHYVTGSGENDYYHHYYTEYAVVIRKDGSNKTYRIVRQDDDTIYNYYQIGDRVRYHGGLNNYEKYDKSRDRIIFCAACGSLNKIEDDYCFRCKLPLLK